RLIWEALYHRRPVYMAFPTDVANQPVVSTAAPLDPPNSDPAALEEAAAAIVQALDAAKTACILPGVLASRARLQDAVQAFVDASGFPFATMLMDKSTLEEQQPSYIGMYDGKLMDEAVREYVESCDAIVLIGAILTDFSTGAFTAHLDPEKTIDIRHHHTQVGTKVYPNVEMKDVLAELARRVKNRNQKPPFQPGSLGPVKGAGSDPITADALYPRWADFIKPNDIVITETGT